MVLQEQEPGGIGSREARGSYAFSVWVCRIRRHLRDSGGGLSGEPESRLSASRWGCRSMRHLCGGSGPENDEASRSRVLGVGLQEQELGGLIGSRLY